MPELTTIVDTTTDKIIRENAKKAHVSISHYLNDIIRQSLILEKNTDNIASLIQSSKLLTVYKKLLIYSLENLTLIQYLVKNLGDDTFKNSNEYTIHQAHEHAISYVEGLFGT